MGCLRVCGKKAPLCRPLRPSVTLREAKGLWAKGAGCYRQSCLDSSAALRMTDVCEDPPIDGFEEGVSLTRILRGPPPLDSRFHGNDGIYGHIT